jgi:NAD(P)-dependent dehydrogenase (short-subunit alcohol dehydrogenase family)
MWQERIFKKQLKRRRTAMGIMDNKVCIVTGAAGSIGLASAAILLREGARVMLVDYAEDKLIKSHEMLNLDKERADYVCANVADADHTKKYINKTVEKWGNIDVLFSNAGISGVIKPITEYPEDIFDEVLAINIKGTFLACKFSLPQMNDGGSIIVTSSIMGATADPGVCGYSTSKHALTGLVRTVAKEVAHRNIRVNILAPGPIDNTFQSDIEERLTEIVGEDGTEMLNRMIPLGRHGKAEEVASMLLFLASNQSSFSTGSIFFTDGGMNI